MSLRLAAGISLTALLLASIAVGFGSEDKKETALLFQGRWWSDARKAIALNLKESQDGKLSGNSSLDGNTTTDVKEGRVTAQSIYFKAASVWNVGNGPVQFIYEYDGVLKDGKLIITRRESIQSVEKLLRLADTQLGRQRVLQRNGLEPTREWILTRK